MNRSLQSLAGPLFPRPATLRGCALAAVLAIAVPAGAARAGEVADALETLAGNTIVSGQVSLRDLGVSTPIALGSSDARRELYLPVPAGVALRLPTLDLDARYLRGDGGRTTFVVSLDGSAVSARSFTGDAGDGSLSIGVDGSPRPDGFVRLGLAWSSTVGQNYCEDERAIGNVLEIAPTTRLSYSYDSTAVTDIAGAWTALPRQVTLLVAHGALEQDSFDAAWRVGLALQRAGKRVRIGTVPAVGDRVDLAGVEVPQPLRDIPAFAALTGDTHRVIADPAEVGALLLLAAPGVHADVSIADKALSDALEAALNAVAAQIVDADPEAADVLTRLRPGALGNAGERAVRLTELARRPVIAVAPGAGAPAAALFDDLWRRTAVARHLTVNAVGAPSFDGDRLSFSALGKTAGNLEVLASADWSSTFDLAESIARGKVPGALSIDVSAAPGATATSPVASVFLNDHLLGARRLDADGRPERITAQVPDYVLQPRNTLRVRFQRQPRSDHCSETPQAFPAAVLPSSFIGLKAPPPANDFTGIVPRLSGEATLFVPDAWRDAPAQTLPAIIDITDAGGVSPSRARLAMQAGDAAATPTGPFLAFDTPVTGVSAAVDVAGDRVILSDDRGNVFYDVAGLEGVAVVRAVSDGTHGGILYRTVGDRPLAAEKPFRLSGGDIAIVARNGVLTQLATRNVDAVAEAGDRGFSIDRLLAADGPLATSPYFSDLQSPEGWRRALPLLVPLAAIAAFLLLLFVAWRARRRNANRKA